MEQHLILLGILNNKKLYFKNYAETIETFHTIFFSMKNSTNKKNLETNFYLKHALSNLDLINNKQIFRMNY